VGGIVLLAGEKPSSRMVAHALLAEFPLERIIFEADVPRLEFLRKRAKRLGVFTVLGQLMFQATVPPLLARSSRQRIAEIKSSRDLDDSPLPEALITRVSSANSPETIERLRQLRPKVVVINGTRILSEELLAATPATFINTHTGITPLYRGVHGSYWALASGDPEHCGVTVHIVDHGIDTGGIVAQAVIQPTAEDNFVTYPLLQLAVGLPLLKQAVRAALEDRLVTHAGAGPSRLWSHPTLYSYLSCRLRKGVR
jgi:folate-dependent phosphoribosylglycinamide formyltransferase PurN